MNPEAAPSRAACIGSRTGETGRPATEQIKDVRREKKQTGRSGESASGNSRHTAVSGTVMVWCTREGGSLALTRGERERSEEKERSRDRSERSREERLTSEWRAQ